jgi:zinc protease
VAQTAANRTLAFVEKVDAQIEVTSLEEVNAAIRKSKDPAKFLNIYAGDFAAAAKK